MKVQPRELQPSAPETSAAHVLAYMPGQQYPLEPLQDIADFFQRNFPHNFYPREVEEEQLALHRHGAQLQQQIDGGATWLAATDAAGNVTSVLRMGEREPGQFHLYWLITDAEHRREGLGSELVGQAKELLSGDEATKDARLTASVHMANEASLNLFKGLGFGRFDETYPERMEVSHTTYFAQFVKRLSSPTDQRVAVVTGASRGFGNAIYRRLVEQDWAVIGIATENGEPRLQALVEEAGGAYRICDISDPAQIAETASFIIGEYPSIDLLVNNAGIPMRKHLMETDPKEVTAVMETNHRGGLRLAEELLPALEAEGGADLVDMVSAAGTIINPNSAAYSVSKAAQLAASRCSRIDLAPLGITVHAVLPGKADTEGHPQPRKRSPVSRLMAAATGTDVDTVAEVVTNRPGQRPAELYVPKLLKAVAVIDTVAPVTTTRIVNGLLR